MPPDSSQPPATLLAGIPATNPALYHRIRFAVGDPAALVTVGGKSILILRDIEMDRARLHARADAIACPADFAPPAGLSGDRVTATAQAAAECLRRAGVSEVTADRSLPLIYAHVARAAGIDVTCDPAMGVLDRRAKDAQEIEWLARAQSVTEDAVRMACELIATADIGADGVLIVDGSPLTSERVRLALDVFLLEKEFDNPRAIVAAPPHSGDCHHAGTGPLRTGVPVIVDVFPRDRKTLYWGDCTRTVVHSAPSDAVKKMHAAVVEAKAAAIAAVRAGVTGEEVHAATVAVIRRHGYPTGLPPAGAPADFTSMPHGTGHGVGLEVHEPPLLDAAGPPLLAGDCLTVEPGLYSLAHGGVRVEDMVIVTANGCDNQNRLPEGLDWTPATPALAGGVLG